MSSPTTPHAPTWVGMHYYPCLALTSQGFIDQAQQREMTRLQSGGDQHHQTEDFTFYVLVPLLLLLGLMVVGRRIIS